MARLSAIGVFLAGLMAAVPAASASPILNGDFQTGLEGWTVDAAASGSLLFVTGQGPAGNDSAWFGAVGGRDDTLSQTFATQPGDSYVVSFWLGHGATDNANDFSVWWDSTSLLTLQKASKFGQTYFSFIVSAIDDSATLMFSGRERLNYFYLDDVSVTANGAAIPPVPEPASMSLLLGGLAILIGRAHFARKRVTAPATL